MRLLFRLSRIVSMTLLAAAGSVTVSVAATEPAGAEIYRTHCAQCHDAGGVSRMPQKSALAQLPVAEIVKALTSGVMRQQGSALTDQQRTEVASWLSTAAPGAPQEAGLNRCPAGQTPAQTNRPGWTNWGAGLANQRYQADSGLTAAALPNLKLKWAFGVANAKLMRSQPVVYKGRIYLGSDTGTVVSLDAKTGCSYWTTELRNVRSGLVIGKSAAADALFFGDVAGLIHALDLNTGKQLWQTRVADHAVAFVTGTPEYLEGRLYVSVSSYEEVVVLSPTYPCCSFRGSVAALNSADGKVIWRTHTIADEPTSRGKTKAGVDVRGPSGAAVWGSPTLDPAHNAVYITTGDNYSDPATTTSDAVLALDLQTGKLLWSRQFTANDVYNLACEKPTDACKRGNGPDFDFGASPILVSLPSGKRCLLLGQKSGMVYAVDPDDGGSILWQARAGTGGPLGGIQWGPATDGHRMFAAVSDIGFLASPDPTHLNTDPKVGGGLSAFDIASGKLVWKAPAPVCVDRKPCSPAQSAALTAIPGAVFSGSLDGHMRAYAGNTGAVIWDFDTERSFDTVNHVAAEGGSIDVGGPVVADGMLFICSGYPQYGGKGGNVLLAFGLQ